jgi:hypothetical protein
MSDLRTKRRMGSWKVIHFMHETTESRSELSAKKLFSNAFLMASLLVFSGDAAGAETPALSLRVSTTGLELPARSGAPGQRGNRTALFRTSTQRKFEIMATVWRTLARRSSVS